MGFDQHFIEQIKKKWEIHQTNLKKVTLFFQNKIQKCKIDVKWVGSGRGRLRPVQNDRTDCRNVLGWFLANNSLKKQ